MIKLETFAKNVASGSLEATPLRNLLPRHTLMPEDSSFLVDVPLTISPSSPSRPHLPSFAVQHFGRARHQELLLPMLKKGREAVVNISVSLPEESIGDHERHLNFATVRLSNLSR